MDFNTIQSLQEAYNNVVEQTSTVTSPGGAGGKVTVNKSYPATLNNQKGVKSTGPTGTEYFTPNFPGSSVPNRAEAKFKSVASQQYEKVPKDQRTMDLNKPVSVTDRTKYDPSYKPPGMKKENYEPDNFDIILEYLVAEGYADTNKAALAIMANMSGEWIQSIVDEGLLPLVAKEVGKMAVKKVKNYMNQPVKDTSSAAIGSNLAFGDRAISGNR